MKKYGGSSAGAPSEGIYFQSAVCAACGRSSSSKALDEDDWCDDCRSAMRRRVRRARHMVAAVITLPFAIWILTLERGGTLSQAAWLLPLAAAYYLGWRIGGEVVRGFIRWRGEVSP
ncbi:MAG: hypothetical protein ACC682_12250 [Gemmatimonadota bacterium]